MTKIGFKPQQITDELVGTLPERSREVINRRFGLVDGVSHTLESIGQDFGITRERVRQIENQALKRIRKSKEIDNHQEIFDAIYSKIQDLGHVVSEEDLLEELSQKKDDSNHYYFLLHVGPDFKREKSNTKYHHRWSISDKISKAVHGAIDSLKKRLSKKDLVSEDKLLEMFRQDLSKELKEDELYKDDEHLRNWLKITKEIDSNPLSEWGLSSSPIVRLKGMRDYAYLVLKKNGSPMHFSEVTEKIEQLFGRQAHQATTHNELIRDPRFVLVGRGLYALKEWGYREGVVRDVIADILQENGPLSKDEVIERVLKERYVKPNTIAVNLQDQKHFSRDDEGNYTINS